LADNPTDDDLRLSGLQDHPFIKRRILQESSPGTKSGDEHLYRAVAQPGEDVTSLEGLQIDSSRLTAKEYRLLLYFLSHMGEVCEKDNLIRADWPEDKIFMDGIRDDSLAQLVRRLRKKIELDPEAPRYITTVPGRGYRFMGGKILS
jgi:DNA-binding response OmpR family regulator